ncbi:SprA-related family protein [Vreelandella subterranea]|uniref:SprA-related family protein n=1 Tax=Vreelandella subterranea TaxID=416874 RepID=A0A1H9TKE8_9GAMM|nr:putative metalloprotease CJM1_0395 family protein [Halomonas subterranea]SER97389.1 SprA-related family protein [Halomonas subterranea]
MTIAVLGAASLSAWASPTFNAGSAKVTTAEPKAINASSAESAASSDEASSDNATRGESAGPKRADGTPMAPEEIEQLEQLKQTDRAVRQHEMAHQTVGGAYAGGASYDYEIGPDGRRYAVAGEVSIDYGPVPNDPKATIEKMQTVIAAALAPADPSPKDYQVAAQARQYLLEAKLEAGMQSSEMAQARAGAEGNDRADAPTTNPGTDTRSAA